MLGNLIGAGVGLLGGILNRRPQTTTSTTTSERILTPEQQLAQSSFLSGALDMVSNPGAGLTPIKNNVMQDVNRQFAGAVPRLQSTAALRGFGDSGKLFEGLMGIDMARSGALARTGSDFAGMEIDQRNRGMQMLFQLLGLDNKRTQTTTGNVPGNMAGGAISGLVSSPGFAGILDSLFRRPAGYNGDGISIGGGVHGG